MLSVRDIHTYYGDSYVLQGISLDMAGGQCVAILGRKLRVEVIGKRLQDDAVRRGERPEFHEIAAFENAARRPQRGHDKERVAGLRILDPMQLARIVERDA